MSLQQNKAFKVVRALNYFSELASLYNLCSNLGWTAYFQGACFFFGHIHIVSF